MHYYGGFGGHGFGIGGLAPMLFMLIFWLLVIAGGIYVIRALGKNQAQSGSTSSSSLTTAGESRALEILQERYAKGEIDTTEFEERRRALKGQSPPVQNPPAQDSAE